MDKTSAQTAPTNICQTCKLAHPFVVDGASVVELARCFVAQQDAMAKMLLHIGGPGKCRGCDATIWWVRHNNGKAVPYDASGLNHFVSCPEAKQFKAGKSGA